MNIGGQPKILSTRPRGDIDKLPIELDISTSPLSAVPKLLLGGIFAVAGQAVFGSLPAHEDFGSVVETVFQAVPIIFIAVGAYLFARGTIGMLDKRTLVIADGQVQVSGKSLWRSENWSEPLSAFHGVRWREIVVQRIGVSAVTRSRGPKVYQVLDLQHLDPDRCLPLHVTRLMADIDGTRAKWEHLAKLLGLPAIDEHHGMAQMRAAEDVDKSIKQLAQEGKIRAEVDDHAVPSGLALMREGEQDDPSSQVLAVTILVPRYPLWLYGGLAVFCAFVIIVSLSDLALLPFIFGAGLSVGILWHWRFESLNPRSLRITRTNIELNTPNPGNQTTHALVAHGDIEDVYVGKVDERGILGGKIIIATDGDDYATGAGLSKEALTWLRDLIISAIARA